MIERKDKSPRLSYEEHPVDEVYEEILSCKPMFFDGGGVTFSGGEATMQFEALKELLKSLRRPGSIRRSRPTGRTQGLRSCSPMWIS